MTRMSKVTDDPSTRIVENTSYYIKHNDQPVGPFDGPWEFETPDELLDLLRPGIDGVTLSTGARRATFLPQVWKKIPEPSQFLDRLCVKMGVLPGAWRQPGMRLETYQVIEFSDQ